MKKSKTNPRCLKKPWKTPRHSGNNPRFDRKTQDLGRKPKEWQRWCQTQTSAEGNGHYCNRPSSNWEPKLNFAASDQLMSFSEKKLRHWESLCQCFPTCVPRHTSVPRERLKCAAAECRNSKVFNKKFQWMFQLSFKTFDFLNSATAHFYRYIIIS